jgi:hypothetical protein
MVLIDEDCNKNPALAQLSNNFISVAKKGRKAVFMTREGC